MIEPYVNTDTGLTGLVDTGLVDTGLDQTGRVDQR
jgi:hypothetical protein